jgi:hypothetical protein
MGASDLTFERFADVFPLECAAFELTEIDPMEEPVEDV